jgi:hypothetical protein
MYAADIATTTATTISETTTDDDAFLLIGWTIHPYDINTFRPVPSA